MSFVISPRGVVEVNSQVPLTSTLQALRCRATNANTAKDTNNVFLNTCLSLQKIKFHPFRHCIIGISSHLHEKFGYLQEVLTGSSDNFVGIPDISVIIDVVLKY